MRNKYSGGVFTGSLLILLSGAIAGCVTTAPSTISGKTYNELEAIGAIEASDSCKYLRDQYQSGASMTSVAIAGDKSACEATIQELGAGDAGNGGASPKSNSEEYLDALAAKQPNSFDDFSGSSIDCDFDRHVNGPETFWGIYLGDSPDAFLCSFLKADLPMTSETKAFIVPGTGRMNGFLYEIFGWQNAGYSVSTLREHSATFHALTQVSFRSYVYTNPWGSDTYLDRTYSEFQDSGGPSITDHWSEWASYLYADYENENEETRYREILHLPKIDSDYPDVFWARNQCSSVDIKNVQIGNTEWNVEARFHNVDNGFPLLVDRLKAGEKLHEFGRIDGKPVYSSCILRALVMRSTDNTAVEKSKLVDVYDAIKGKLEGMHPEAFTSEEAKVGDKGSLFYASDGWTLTFAVDEYQGERYPASVIFEYLPEALDKADQRGAEKLAESAGDAKVVL